MSNGSLVSGASQVIMSNSMLAGGQAQVIQQQAAQPVGSQGQVVQVGVAKMVAHDDDNHHGCEK